MNNRVFAHVPYWFLQKDLALVIERRVNPEIHISGEQFDCLDPSEVGKIAAALAENSLRCTMHAPYTDLNPGSTERLVREASLRRFHQLFDAAEMFRPEVIVIHPGYDRWRYGDKKEVWLKNSIDTFSEIVERAAKIDCILAVENIFEEEPSTLKTLLQAMDSPFVRHCFDTGHWNLFVKVSMEEWFAEIGPYIAEAHIHDNAGIRDEHGAIGDGNIDFDLFFSLMGKYAPGAAWTLEAHSKETLERALVAIEKYVKAGE